MIDMRSKIKGFTLSEMLVVILITVVVVGLAFSMLNVVQRQMRNARENLSERSAKNELRQAMWRDFGTFPTLYFDQNQQQLVCTSPIAQVNYLFQEGRVIRDRDTFAIAVKNKNMYFSGQQVLSGKLDAIQLEFEGEQHTTMMIYKINAAKAFME